MVFLHRTPDIISCHAEEIRAHGSSRWIKPAAPLQQKQEHVLCHFLGHLRRTAHVQSKAVDRTLPSPVEGGERVFVSVQRLCQELFVGMFGQQRHLGDEPDVVSISISPRRVGKFRHIRRARNEPAVSGDGSIPPENRTPGDAIQPKPLKTINKAADCRRCDRTLPDRSSYRLRNRQQHRSNQPEKRRRSKHNKRQERSRSGSSPRRCELAPDLPDRTEPHGGCRQGTARSAAMSLRSWCSRSWSDRK